MLRGGGPPHTPRMSLLRFDTESRAVALREKNDLLAAIFYKTNSMYMYVLYKSSSREF